MHRAPSPTSHPGDHPVCDRQSRCQCSLTRQPLELPLDLRVGIVINRFVPYPICIIVRVIFQPGECLWKKTWKSRACKKTIQLHITISTTASRHKKGYCCDEAAASRLNVYPCSSWALGKSTRLVRGIAPHLFCPARTLTQY